jgi:hypothetical protein
MSKTRWAHVTKGDRVELGGKPWTVTRAKAKGKSVKITVTDGKREASSEVRAADKVKLVKAEPLRRPAMGGSQQARWATEREREKRDAKAAANLAPIRRGDPSLTSPPEAPGDDAWTTPRGKAEKVFERVLGARLVGEATDVDKGYYVPPVDVTTVASHMALFHPNAYDAMKDEPTMLRSHTELHKAVDKGEMRLDLNHWHTETRPKVGA